MSVSAAVPAPQQLKKTIRNLAEIQLPKDSFKSEIFWTTSMKFRYIGVFSVSAM